jgi:hypothetical protein
MVERKDYGIIYRHGAAGKETIPSSTRPKINFESTRTALDPLTTETTMLLRLPAPHEKDRYSTGDGTWVNELQERDLYKLQPDEEEHLDIVKTMPMTNTRFTLVAYSDASFAVGELKQSVTGFLVMVNGIPLLWGS